MWGETPKIKFMANRIELRDIDHSLINECWDSLYTLAFRIVADDELAKDIVQESFLKLLGGDRSWDDMGHFANWIKKVVVNCSVDELRKRKKRNHINLDGKQGFEVMNQFVGSSGDTVVSNNDLAGFINLIAGQLPVKQRVVFSLIEIEGLSHDEVNKLTGYSKLRIKSNLSVAKNKVREILKRNM